MEGATNPTPGVHANWENGLFSNRMGVLDVKIRSTAKDSTIGIGGRLTKDVTDNSHKGHVGKENYST